MNNFNKIIITKNYQLFQELFPYMFTSLKYKPLKPRENECCGNGCSDCSWLVYYERIKEFNKFKY